MPDRRTVGSRAPVAERGERKLVSVLFADLAGYTALAASMDAEEVYRFLRPQLHALQRIAETFGGTVPQIMGDGFMAVFGVPIVHEDDAERAVRAALAVRDHVRELNSGSEGLPFPEVHAGVNSGEVMVAPSDEPAGFTVIGDTVNTASRLADLAPGGRVLVDERTRARTSGAIRYGPRHIRQAKGKPDLATYEALGVRSARPATRQGRTPARAFVDRADVMHRLRDETLATEREARSRVLVVTGEPGLGKSRAAAEFRKRLRRGSVLAGRCVPFGPQHPLHAMAEAIGGAAGVSPGAPIKEIEAGATRLAERIAGVDRRTLVREMSLLLAGRVAPGQAPGSVHDALAAVRTVVEGLARMKQPVTVVLDDLQWADPDLVKALEDVSRQPWNCPVLFLGLSRPDKLIAKLPQLELGSLPDPAMLELAHSVLGEAAPRAVVQAPVGLAAGNPLFLEESLGMLVETGALVSGATGWRVAQPNLLQAVPPTIRSLIAARLDGLPPDEKQVLQDASVAGDATWDGLEEHLSEVPDPHRALLSLEGRDLLRRRATSAVPGSVEYGFKHPLIREVAYESLPRLERARRHRQIAEWLRGRAPSASEEPIAALAHHYERAWELGRSTTGRRPPIGTARLAVRYLGRSAAQTFAYQARSAEALYERALRIVQEDEEGIDPRTTATLLTGRAESLIEMGRHREAITHATQARAIGHELGDRRLAARALLALGRAESDAGRMRRARALLEEARGEFAILGDVRGQAWALHHLSETWSRDDYSRELLELRKAHRLFTRSRDRWGRSVAAQDLAYLLTTQGGREFHRWLEEANRLAEDDRDLRSRAAVARTRGYFAYFCGEFGEAIRIMREARPLAAQSGDRYAEADTVLIGAMAAAAVGPPDEAERLSLEALELARELRSARVRATGLLAGARAALRSGSPSLAQSRLRAARLIIEQKRIRVMRCEALLFEAWLALDRGVWDKVSGLGVRLGTAVRASDWLILEPLVPLLRGRASLGAGRPDEARRHLARAASLARSLGSGGFLGLAVALERQSALLAGADIEGRPDVAIEEAEIAAVVQENEGLHALRAGDDEGAAKAFERAVETWSTMGRTAWLARSLSLHAAAEKRRGDRRMAGRLYRRAEAVLDELKTPARNRSSILSPIDH